MPSVSEKQHRAMEAAAHGNSTLGIPEEVGKEFVAADETAEKKGEGGLINLNEVREKYGRKFCAGILFRTNDNKFLLVKRSDNGQWEQPGGHIEAEETPEQAAIRESQEEIGLCPPGKRWLVRVNETEEVIYSCFLQDVEEFIPTLNHEHTNFVWATADGLPSDTHPEVVRTVQAVQGLELGTELDVAKAIREGQLGSPQQYENIWLFDVRVTGTGTSYRKAHDEYVYRPPEHFLTDDFLERCNGLPLIFEHPSTLLTTEEFRNRSIGTVILPYIKGDEVWGIAKVFDEDAAKLMMTTHASTSPAVMFRDADSTETIQIDGKTVLIEGKPSLLDHLAICEVGVWDKGGEPSGVNNNGEVNMENGQNMEQAPAWFDSYSRRMDARMDALESKVCADRKDSDEKGEKDKEAEAKEKEERKDSEETKEKEEKVEDRKDSDEEAKKEEEKERADSAAREAALQAKIDAMEARLSSVTKPRSDEDKNALCNAQLKADAVAQMFGKRVRQPFFGESPIEYRKSIANEFKTHSAEFKSVKLDALDEVTFKAIEDRIYSDAKKVAMDSAQSKSDILIPMVHEDSAGRKITTFAGHPNAWMRHFKSPCANVRLNIANGRDA